MRRQSRIPRHSPERLALPGPEPDEGPADDKGSRRPAELLTQHSSLRACGFQAQLGGSLDTAAESGHLRREDTSVGYATKMFASVPSLPSGPQETYGRGREDSYQFRGSVPRSRSASPPLRSRTAGLYREHPEDATVFSPLGASRPRLTGDGVSDAAPRKPDIGHIEPRPGRLKKRSLRRDRSPGPGAVVSRTPSMSSVVAPGGLPHASLREHSWTAERPGTIRKDHGSFRRAVMDDRIAYGAAVESDPRGVRRGGLSRDVYESEEFRSGGGTAGEQYIRSRHLGPHEGFRSRYVGPVLYNTLQHT